MSQISSFDRVLLDTNAFLFFINNDPRLTEQAKGLLELDCELLISSASLWEIAIKISIGKLGLPDTFANFVPLQLAKNSIEILQITLVDFERLSTLPFHHKDPFDRMIIAQALVEDVPVVSSDASFDIYGVERVW